MHKKNIRTMTAIALAFGLTIGTCVTPVLANPQNPTLLKAFQSQTGDRLGTLYCARYGETPISWAEMGVTVNPRSVVYRPGVVKGYAWAYNSHQLMLAAFNYKGNINTSGAFIDSTIFPLPPFGDRATVATRGYIYTDSKALVPFFDTETKEPIVVKDCPYRERNNNPDSVLDASPWLFRRLEPWAKEVLKVFRVLRFVR